MSEPDKRPDDPTAAGAFPHDDVPGSTSDGAGETPGDAGLSSGDDAALAEAQAKAAEFRDMALRAHADMDNLRKRHQAEIAAAHKYAIESFAEALLPVRDSLEMALKADVPSVENLREGVEATLRLLAGAFEKNRLQAIDPAGEKFDPNLHQAISMVPAGDVPANHVVTVLQKGYLINDRVLRPALVTVRAPS